MQSKGERRRIVEETYERGTSVARAAWQHGVNANQIFNWRRLYREGKLEVDSEMTARPNPIQRGELPAVEPLSCKFRFFPADLRTRIQIIAGPD